MDRFGYAVDFLAIGDKSQSGDAIVIRWGYDLDFSSKSQWVMLIDGGHAYSANGVVDHIKRYCYNNPSIPREQTIVHALINTHPHSDHFSGIPTIFDKTAVQVVAMHRPWSHKRLPGWFRDGRVTATGIKNQLKEGLESAYSFSNEYKKVMGRDTLELYAGYTEELPYGVKLYVLGPSEGYYNRLIPDFNSTPTDGIGIGENRVVLKGKDVPAYLGPLSDDGDTSAENLSGLILALEMPNGNILLFTGDAGQDSMARAMRQFMRFGLDVGKITFFQVPHHGSCQNLGPSLLNSIFGMPGHPNQREAVTTFISVAAHPDYAHPSRRVVNALLSRNCNVYKTQGINLCHSYGVVKSRQGWYAVQGLGYSQTVEG